MSRSGRTQASTRCRVTAPSPGSSPSRANQCIDRLRARKPSSEELTEAEEIADQSATPEQHVVHNGEAKRLQTCLEKLSPGRAEAVKAAYMEGYSYQETGRPPEPATEYSAHMAAPQPHQPEGVPVIMTDRSNLTRR